MNAYQKQLIPMKICSPIYTDLDGQLEPSTIFSFKHSHAMKTAIIQKKVLECSALVWSGIGVAKNKQAAQASSGGSLNILADISGIAEAGNILAVMGTSGVGKTTLMNVLSGQYTDNTLTTAGNVYLNGQLTTRTQRQSSNAIGYVEQYEPFIETMTLQEHLIFQAMLRMKPTLDDAERREYVTNVSEQLHLSRCASTVIARLSGGEKKRLAFATVLLTDPHVVLIDEPTSGLDTYMAKSLMNVIRSMAVEQNHAVIVVLHQPTSSMFDQIDTLCLLVQGGRQAYFGSKENAQEFFTTKCGLVASSLDGFIEQLAAPLNPNDHQSTLAQNVAADQYTTSREAQLLLSTIERQSRLNHKASTIFVDESRRAAFGRQMKWLLWRSFNAGRRNPMRTTKLAARLLIMALILGFAFSRLTSNSPDYVRNRNSLLYFFLLVLFESNMTNVLVGIVSERSLVVREYRRRMYSLGAYYLNRLIIDIGYIVITSIPFMAIVVLLTGLHRWVLLMSITVLSIINGCAVASILAALSSTPKMGLLIMTPIQQILATLCGIFINLRSIPFYFKWLQYITYWYYAYTLILTLEWHHEDISLPCDRRCLSEGGETLSQTSNKTCTRTGDNILYQYNVDYHHFNRNIFILSILTIIFHIVAFLIIASRIRRIL
ncbi:unnamed protein product [Adineta ricciae]|uniref:ABC transporter domain-containing protein n=1 Tax=Adineta ricciae TaxID=249248 RepID=A0A815TY53_ADIRI|nr:unnamed protein product [Adineta ricciae]